MKNIKKEHGYNIKELEFLGKGTQGAVYKIDNHKCIKIFKKYDVFKNELKALQMGQKRECFPQLYDWGQNFIIREYIDGIELDKYLSVKPLTIDISNKLIEIYEALIAVGYNRHDTALLHVFITPKGQLKVIDTAKAMVKHSRYPFTMINDLKQLGYKDTFMHHMKILRPDLYIKFTEKMM